MPVPSPGRVQVQERFVKTLRHPRRWQNNLCAVPIRDGKARNFLVVQHHQWYYMLCGCVMGIPPFIATSRGDNDDQPLAILGHFWFSEKPWETGAHGHGGCEWLSVARRWLSLMSAMAGLLLFAAEHLKAANHVSEVFWLMQTFTKKGLLPLHESRQHGTLVYFEPSSGHNSLADPTVP